MATDTTNYIKKQHSLLTNIQQTRESVLINVKMAKHDITLTATRSRDAIDSNERDLLRNLARYKEEVLRKVVEVENNYLERDSEASKFQQNINCLRQFGKDINLVEETSIMQKQMRVRLNTEQQHMAWTYSCKDMQQPQ